MKLPKVILVMAISADGYITKHDDGLVNWSSKEDKKHFVQITKDTGAIICGRKTYDTYGKPLPGRLNIVMTRTPDVSKNIEGLLEYTNQPPLQILENLQQRGYKKVALTGGSMINTMFLEHNLIDEIYLTIEPKIFGSGKKLFEDMHKDISLELVDSSHLNSDTILLHYRKK